MAGALSTGPPTSDHEASHEPPTRNTALATHALSPTEANHLRIYEIYPHLPPSLRQRSSRYTLVVQLCIARNGRVADVVIERSASQELDAAVLTALHTWRYRPLLVAGVPTPFCHRMQIDYDVQ